MLLANIFSMEKLSLLQERLAKIYNMSLEIALAQYAADKKTFEDTDIDTIMKFVIMNSLTMEKYAFTKAALSVVATAPSQPRVD